MKFDVTVVSDSFQVGQKEISLKSKESTKISVSFKPPADVTQPMIMDKLIVSCGKTQWLFYLKGVC